MKVISMFIMLLTFFIYSTNKEVEPTFYWIVDIKNENSTNDMIELRPGVLTKIILKVRNETNMDSWKRIYDKYNYSVTIYNENHIRLYPNKKINIVPSLSLEYIAYIGLNSDHDINTDNKTLIFHTPETFDLNGYWIGANNIKINNIVVKINNNPTIIDIEPIETNLSAGGFSHFKITNEIYNFEKIKIKPSNYNEEIFKVDSIEIKPFFQRKLFGKGENDNHGILFDYKFGTQLEYSSLDGEIKASFNLEIENDGHNTKCFEISNKSKIVNLTINEKKILTLNDSVKEAILYNIENITPKRDKTNNIQIKVDIPFAPIILKCELEAEGEDDIKYNDYILNSGQYIIKFNNLNPNKEYKVECIFSSNAFDKTEFEITMGNDKEKDFITRLFPSKSLYGTPQCIEFTLVSESEERLEEQIKIFRNSVEMLCNKTMVEDENILFGIKGNFICEKPKIEVDEQYYKNKSIICIGISPSYNSENINEEDINELKNYFSERVEKFIRLVNTTTINTDLYNQEDQKDLINLKIISLKRYIDLNPPDLNKIKLDVVSDGGMAKKSELKFKITSSNEQPIECFYNKEMKPDDNRRFINLYYTEEDSNSIILFPNVEKTFETHLEDVKDNNIYSLYMNCYNLPGTKIRIEQTDIFNPYTYLYTDIEEDQSIFEKQNVTINCAEKENKMNPNCLKGAYNNLNKMLKTKMPETDENEEVEKFSKLSNSAKLNLLEEKFKNFDEEIEQNNNFSNNIKNIINKGKYLINVDCSIYTNGSSNNSLNETNNKKYKKCRENKKIKQQKIMKYLKNNLNCQYLSRIISRNGISKNVEENIKYVILLIEVVTNNADSFTENDSEVLLNIINCLQENFEDYWNQVKDYLYSKGTLNQTISTIKEDISTIIINSLANLVKVLHFDEIDNYISENEKNITSKGLMASKKGKAIHKNMKQFVKNFNEFGDGLYNLSDSLIINVTINNDYKENSLKEENEIDEKIIKYEDKGIVLLLNPQSMMKKFNAYAMQIINYDSPLISIKTDDDIDNNILNTFISITLYDNKGNEIKVDKIPEDIRPKILYNKELYKFMNNCFFYNEEIEDLSERGISINDNYKYGGIEYLKCTVEHLTCFTAGNYYSKSSSSNSDISNKDSGGIITFITLGSILAVILIVIIIIIIVKKKRKRDHTDDNIRMEMEDIDSFE